MEAIRKYGVDVDIIINVEIKSKTSQIKSLKFKGKMNSIEVMSLLNLFKMRPIGVDSKNDNLDRIIDDNICLCSFLEELSTILTANSSATIEKKSNLIKKKLNSIKIRVKAYDIFSSCKIT